MNTSQFWTNISRNFRRMSTEHKRHKTAGMIVIGDEILKGQVTDLNSPISCKILHNYGVKMKKISVIGDQISDVSREVASFSNSFDYVITTGGIGPTHDDITFEGVANAFGESLVKNTEMEALCVKYYSTFPIIKLSQVPQSAEVKFYPDLIFPCITVKNVFLFPGIPEYFQKAFTTVARESFQSTNRFHTRAVYLNVSEDQILENLNLLVKLCPEVEFGCYPTVGDDKYKVKITIESSDENATNEAYLKLIRLVPKQVIVK